MCIRDRRTPSPAGLFELHSLAAVQGVLKASMVYSQIDFQPRDIGDMAEINLETEVLLYSDQPIAFHEAELWRWQQLDPSARSCQAHHCLQQLVQVAGRLNPRANALPAWAGTVSYTHLTLPTKRIV